MKQKEYWTSKVRKANQQWQIDIIGPMPKSEDENRYILTAVDVYSRYMHAKAIKSKSKEEVA
ncbi:MAG: hypothetical protein ACRDDF_07810, partial [Aeromonas sp.]